MQIILNNENEIKEYLNWKYKTTETKSEAVIEAKKVIEPKLVVNDTEANTTSSVNQMTIDDVRVEIVKLQEQKGKDLVNNKVRELFKKFNVQKLSELKQIDYQTYVDNLKIAVTEEVPY